ncbi:hypothetical protein PGT21_006643 [Puccinia graminis f. sp. tritici]|uniref:Smr domain-containing protein n=1 Tax=Puccinia graminis f. sp. tritici TaxID=56615 RepID=A0A5B0LYM9_PUCGR|nr:hypothetical protein PGT21_006643 [Puccinia graminis f. sp. tritici]
MSQLLERLLAKFSPPLEPALIIALSSDFDHDTQESAEQDIESKLDHILTQLINEQQEQQQLAQETQPEEKQQQLVTIQTDHSSQSQKLINQVQAILPDLSETTIYHAISDAPEPKKLEQIIDILLAPTPPATVESTPRSDKKSKNKRKKKFDTIHLNDVLQRETHKRLIEQAGQHLEKTSINNDWAIGDSQISYLADLLGIEVGKINSIYHRKSCNLVLTLEELLRISESQKRLDGSKDQDWFDRLKLQLDFLRTTLLTEDDQVLTRLLIVTNLNPGHALDLWIFLDDLHARYGTLPFNQFISNPSSSSSSYPSSSSSTAVSLHNQSKANPLISSSSSPTAVASSSSAAAAPSRPFSVNVQPTTRPQYSSREIENSVMILRSRREYLNQKSRSSRQLIANSHAVSHNKQAIQNSIAMIYAEGSRRLNEKIQDWELLLARKTVQERQRIRNDSLSIDLHGLTKPQAIIISSDYLQAWWSNHSYSVNNFNSSFVHPFKIVTGAGTHSTNCKPALLPTIMKFLDQEKWKWKVDDERSNGLIGSVIVVGRARNRA